MGAETDRIARILEKTFDKHPWYGMSIMEILSDVKPEIIQLRHGNTNSILELVRHMTSWRIFAAKRLQGDNTYEVSPEMNFPKGGTWKEALDALQASQRMLVDAVRNFQEDKFGELVPSKTQKYTYYTLLHGVTHHDLYHLGQIAYIKKSFS